MEVLYEKKVIITVQAKVDIDEKEFADWLDGEEVDEEMLSMYVSDFATDTPEFLTTDDKEIVDITEWNCKILNSGNLIDEVREIQLKNNEL